MEEKRGAPVSGEFRGKQETVFYRESQASKSCCLCRVPSPISLFLSFFTISIRLNAGEWREKIFKPSKKHLLSGLQYLGVDEISPNWTLRSAFLAKWAAFLYEELNDSFTRKEKAEEGKTLSQKG